MRIEHIPLRRLRAMLRATIELAGEDSQAAAILRREVARRRKPRKLPGPKGGPRRA